MFLENKLSLKENRIEFFSFFYRSADSGSIGLTLQPRSPRPAKQNF
jgi:hypothetical protein